MLPLPPKSGERGRGIGGIAARGRPKDSREFLRLDAGCFGLPISDVIFIVAVGAVDPVEPGLRRD